MDIEKVIYVEKAYTKDAECLLYIQKQAFEPLYKIYNDKESPYLEDLDILKRKINYKEGYYYKVLLNEVLCGGIFVFKLSKKKYKIGNIYIAPDFQNKGIGKRVIKIVETSLLNAEEWEIDFPVDQHVNRKCYVSSDYSDTGKREVINDKLTLAFFTKKIY
jgi:GNAT superfamily N-acetyltransferase